ncbi:hypothetical protein B0I35DRAFT_45630 [Stachybotrys elegans]|uniref:FAD/NAD(P)-binding domain-containing protein n=1 Tax=Stachybotrys elegans TaxID=80388 RepID=A0A8K0WX91_9HYPO|nr:hypothetical protein B0I35DRAFT_45630 [Stachybotrys elegans]
MTSKLYDVLIIGGGPGGLSIATALARQVYSGLIIDSGVYRNAYTKHMHNVPGYDHADPAVFRAKVREDLKKRYDTVEFAQATIKTVRKSEEGIFEAVDDNGVVYRGKKLGLGTGVRDMLEKEVEGYAECWGKGIFHCLFCHGFEERGAKSSGVLATGFLSSADMVSHISLMAKRLSDRVTIYTNGNDALAAETQPKLLGTKVRIDNRRYTRFQLQGAGPAVEMTFEDGSTAVEGFIASHPSYEQAAPFAAQLGLETLPSGEVKVSPPFNETSLAGCFAVGDAATPMKSVLQAMQMGCFTAVGMVSQLQHELASKDEL